MDVFFLPCCQSFLSVLSFFTDCWLSRGWCRRRNLRHRGYNLTWLYQSAALVQDSWLSWYQCRPWGAVAEHFWYLGLSCLKSLFLRWWYWFLGDLDSTFEEPEELLFFVVVWDERCFVILDDPYEYRFVLDVIGFSIDVEGANEPLEDSPDLVIESVR
jgi:hypothetical protein